MDCVNLADTGVNSLVFIVLGLSLIVASLFIYWRIYRKNRWSLRTHTILLFWLMGAALLAGSMPGSVARAAGQQCVGQTSQSTTPPYVQTLWNIGFNANGDWDDFTYYNFNPDGVGTRTLTAAAGTGTVTSSRPDHASSANDRAMYVFESAPNVKDGEARALITTENTLTGVNTQAGLALRASNLGDPTRQVAVVMWNNVIFGGTGTSILGVWQGNQDAGGTFRHDDLGTILVGDSITSLVANGTTGTVTISGDLDPSMAIGTSVGLGNVDPTINGIVTVASIVDTHTFTFSTTKTGSWSSGRLDYSINSQRWFAIRVIGNQATIKHWLPNQPEPSWTDPVYSYTSTLPTTLLNGDASPTSGKFALIVAHMGDTKTIKFSNVSFKSLD